MTPTPSPCNSMMSRRDEPRLHDHRRARPAAGRAPARGSLAADRVLPGRGQPVPARRRARTADVAPDRTRRAVGLRAARRDAVADAVVRRRLRRWLAGADAAL